MVKPRVIVSVTNDLSHDQRVHKVCTVLQELGYDVMLVGRILKNSLPLERSYSTRRFRLPFNKGVLFYACYNIRLFLFLLGSRASVFHANDLDTLPANYFASVFTRAKVIYDSHEYFTEVPELVDRKLQKAVWKAIESFIFPRLHHVITVNRSIADAYEGMYKVKVEVLRNVPFLKDTLRIELAKKSREELGLPHDKKIIILQGAWINVDRGGEEAVMMMKHLPGFHLLIVGGGDVYDDLKELAVKEQVESSVTFYGKLKFEDLRQLTMNADLGISFDKGTNLNYLFSLPNKLFDYIHAGIPVLVSNLPEVSAVVRQYNIGRVINTHEPLILASTVREMLDDHNTIETYRHNCKEARTGLCWESESQILRKFY